jgi:gluconate 2-dehydrogenase gamma chain
VSSDATPRESISPNLVAEPAHGVRPSLGERESALLAAIVERLVPTDEHGPGAREANVAGYIESALATDYRAHLATYVEGLGALDRYARSAHEAGFLDLTAEQQDAVLGDAESGKADAAFFELVRQHTCEGMFGDPAWGGNAGYIGWRLLDYAGPRHVWTREQQELDAAPPLTYPAT